MVSSTNSEPVTWFFFAFFEVAYYFVFCWANKRKKADNNKHQNNVLFLSLPVGLGREL
jgi:hypothetical protein